MMVPSGGLPMKHPAVNAWIRPCPCPEVLTICSFGGLREVQHDRAEDPGLSAMDVEHVDRLRVDAVDPHVDVGAAEVAAEAEHAVAAMAGRLVASLA